MIFHSIYILLTLLNGIYSFSEETIGVALSGLVVPVMCWFAGSGLKGSLYGTPGQKVAGFLCAMIFMAGGILWWYFTQFVWSGCGVEEVSGITWILIGFAGGFIFTTKHDAVLN